MSDAQAHAHSQGRTGIKNRPGQFSYDLSPYPGPAPAKSIKIQNNLFSRKNYRLFTYTLCPYHFVRTILSNTILSGHRSTLLTGEPCASFRSLKTAPFSPGVSVPRQFFYRHFVYIHFVYYCIPACRTVIHPTSVSANHYFHQFQLLLTL